jgi:hypothetical protein
MCKGCHVNEHYRLQVPYPENLNLLHRNPYSVRMGLSLSRADSADRGQRAFDIAEGKV